MRVTSEYYDGGAVTLTSQRPETGSRGWTLSLSGPGPSGNGGGCVTPGPNCTEQMLHDSCAITFSVKISTENVIFFL